MCDNKIKGKKMKIVFRQVEDGGSNVTTIVDEVKDSISIRMVNNKFIVYDTESGKTLFKNGDNVKLYDKGRVILHYSSKTVNQ